MTHVLQSGDLLDGRFRLDAKLGQGAFGAVFRAEDLERDGQPVAVKVLFDKYHEDRKTRQRFIQEAELLQGLEHPNIATAFQWRADDDLAYLVMELIDGVSLDQRCEQHSEEGRPIPLQGVAWTCEQLCAAIDFAHQQGVIHRDLKPRNVMVNQAGARPFVKVLDFGIAKVLVGGKVDPTTVGRVLGSVLYIAPEQILSRPLDHRADVFSLGTIFFEILTLRRAWARTADGEPHPFHVPVPIGDINNHVAVLRRIAREARPSACAIREDLPASVDTVLHKAMAIDANERFESAQALSEALRLALVDGLGANDPLLTGAGSLEVTLSDRPRGKEPSPALQLDALPPEDSITTMPPQLGLPPATTEPGELVKAPQVATPPPPAPAARLEPTNTMDESMDPALVLPVETANVAPAKKPWVWAVVAAAVGFAAAFAAFAALGG